MTNVHKRRLMYVLLLLIGLILVVVLVLFALRQNINLFYTPTELVNNANITNNRIRIGGMVQQGTIVYGSDLNISFVVTDYQNQLEVKYNGILPDLFREGQGVVALGKLDSNNVFQADQILAKHDEKYMPPLLNSIVEQSN